MKLNKLPAPIPWAYCARCEEFQPVGHGEPTLTERDDDENFVLEPKYQSVKVVTPMSDKKLKALIARERRAAVEAAEPTIRDSERNRLFSVMRKVGGVRFDQKAVMKLYREWEHTHKQHAALEANRNE